MPSTGAVEYHWTKGGKSIDSDKIMISNNVLVVTPRAKNDYGVFGCQASNSADNTSSCRITLTEMKDKDEDEEGEYWLVKENKGNR